MMRTYLGDGVYVEYADGGFIKLTTENGVSVTNTVLLDAYVMKSFDLWRAHLDQRIAEDAEAHRKGE